MGGWKDGVEVVNKGTDVQMALQPCHPVNTHPIKPLQSSNRKGQRQGSFSLLLLSEQGSKYQHNITAAFEEVAPG